MCLDEFWDNRIDVQRTYVGLVPKFAVQRPISGIGKIYLLERNCSYKMIVVVHSSLSFPLN